MSKKRSKNANDDFFKFIKKTQKLLKKFLLLFFFYISDKQLGL